MKKLLVLLSLVMLTGCASNRIVPVTMNFPQAPEPLLLEPEQLEPLPEDTKQLSELLENSTVNYGKYRKLQLKYIEWQNWYKSQKLIHKETTK